MIHGNQHNPQISLKVFSVSVLGLSIVVYALCSVAVFRSGNSAVFEIAQDWALAVASVAGVGVLLEFTSVRDLIQDSNTALVDMLTVKALTKEDLKKRSSEERAALQKSLLDLLLVPSRCDRGGIELKGRQERDYSDMRQSVIDGLEDYSARSGDYIESYRQSVTIEVLDHCYFVRSKTRIVYVGRKEPVVNKRRLVPGLEAMTYKVISARHNGEDIPIELVLPVPDRRVDRYMTVSFFTVVPEADRLRHDFEIETEYFSEHPFVKRSLREFCKDFSLDVRLLDKRENAILLTGKKLYWSLFTWKDDMPLRKLVSRDEDHYLNMHVDNMWLHPGNGFVVSVQDMKGLQVPYLPALCAMRIEEASTYLGITVPDEGPLIADWSLSSLKEARREGELRGTVEVERDMSEIRVCFGDSSDFPKEGIMGFVEEMLGVPVKACERDGRISYVVDGKPSLYWDIFIGTPKQSDSGWNVNIVLQRR